MKTKNKKKSMQLKEDIAEALEDKEKKYTVNYKRIAYGFGTVYAKSKKEAQERIEGYDFDDEFDNKVEYELEQIEEQT